MTASISMEVDGLSGHLFVLLLRISLGVGIFGLMGVDHMSRRRSSREVLAPWLVLSVLTCHSMKQLDQGKWGDEVV